VTQEDDGGGWLVSASIDNLRDHRPAYRWPVLRGCWIRADTRPSYMPSTCGNHR